MRPKSHAQERTAPKSGGREAARARAGVRLPGKYDTAGQKQVGTRRRSGERKNRAE